MKNTRTSLAFAILVGLGLSGPVMAQSMDHSKPQHDTMGESDQPGTDTWITTKVKADLLASGKVSGTDVSVETVNGVVMLSGHVTTQAEKNRAVTEAKGIKGVKKVDASKLAVGMKHGEAATHHDAAAKQHDAMDHKSDHAMGMESDQPGTDTWITTKVKSDLLASGKTTGTDISVTTKNGVVWLSGMVATQAEKDRAIVEAKGIEGVKKVEAGKLMVGKKM